MRHDKLQRELDLILMLSDSRYYSVEELSDRLNLSLRNVYYYLDFLRQSNFLVEKQGNRYRINRRSPFIKKLTTMLDFSEDEAIFISQLLDGANPSTPQVRSIRQKLNRFYDLNILDTAYIDEQYMRNIAVLYKAIKYEQMAKICGYESQHSQTKSNRIVEPFSMINHNTEVRCYELKSGQCKTFKLSRMEHVELIDLKWTFREQHRKMHTDVFMFSAEETTIVELILGKLSATLLLEEYPGSAAYLSPADDGRYGLRLPVCSFLGIGRFVKGLAEDIEVVAPEEFKDYLSRNKPKS